MSEYIPTPGPLEGERWTPSNGTDGASFLTNVCTNCARDKVLNGTVSMDDHDDEDLCPIIAASYRGEAVEWRRMPDGEVKCIAFVPVGQPIPPKRCEATMDMFDKEEA